MHIYALKKAVHREINSTIFVIATDSQGILGKISKPLIWSMHLENLRSKGHLVLTLCPIHLSLQESSSLNVALLKLPRRTSTSHMLGNSNVFTLYAVLRNFIYKFMGRLKDSKNEVMLVLTEPTGSSIRYSPCFCKYWLFGCFVVYVFCIYSIFLMDQLCHNINTHNSLYHELISKT